MELIKKLLPFIILVGVASFVFITAFGTDNTLLTQKTINGITFYTFDLSKHLANLQTNAEVKPFLGDDLLPTRQWIGTWSNAQEWWNAFVNNLAVVFQWIYFPLNLVLYVLRWIIWAGRLMLAFLGLPSNSQIMMLITDIIDDMLIPYF